MYSGSSDDVYDQPLVNTYALTAAPNPETELADEARTVKSVGASHSVCDGHGQHLSVTIPGGAPANSPMESLAYEGAQVTDGILVDATAEETVRSNGLNASFSIADQVGSARRITRDRLQITTSFDELTATATGGPLLSRSLSTSASAPQETGKITRTYTKRDGKYVLEEVLIESEAKTDKGVIKSKQRMQLRNVRWYENKEEDKKRKEKREQATKTAFLSPPTNPSFSWGCEDGAIVDEYGNTCVPDDRGSTGGGGTTDPCPPVNRGQNIVLQHGILADSTTWTKRMKGWLRCDWQLATELTPSFHSLSSHSDQSYGQMNRIEATGPSECNPAASCTDPRRCIQMRWSNARFRVGSPMSARPRVPTQGESWITLQYKFSGPGPK